MDKNASQIERFKRLEDLYHSALKLDEAERQALLSRACADDETMRQHVEALLAAQAQAPEFLSQPAFQLEARERARQLAQPSSHDDQPTAPQVALPGRVINQYEIVAPLGRGGMGEVWLAEDKRLQRKVALKLLPVEFAHERDRVRRFEQEAHAVSMLNHPNIVTLFDFGQTDEAYFITTEFVDGQTLRARLHESARPSVHEAIEIALQICAALTAAHAAGILHRDIKPENIMLRRDGYVKVLDFGLARITGPARPVLQSGALPPAPNNTGAGSVLGTASYMSPEQARGALVDARTDIFSLGIVLYEMLAGHLPFAGETPSQMRAAILNSEPLPLPGALSNTDSAVVTALQRLLARALVKDCEARYQTIQALANDLKQCAETVQFQARLAQWHQSTQPAQPRLTFGTAARVSVEQQKAVRRAARLRLLALGALVSATLLLGWSGWWKLKPTPPTPGVHTPIKTLAVLPFRFLGSERAEEYLGLGMTETLIAKLGGTQQMTVRPTSAVLKYQNAAVEPDRLTRELQTDAVIQGSIQKVGDKLRVTVQLIRADAAQPLWTGEFNESANALFTLQDKLAARLSEELGLRLTGLEQQQLDKRPTANDEAWRLFLQGRFFANKWTAEGLVQARSFYERALARDPNFALAYAELAVVWSDLAERGHVPAETGSKQVLALITKAVELDDGLAEAHAYLGFVRLAYAWDLTGAEAELQRALKLNPQQVETRQFYGVYLLAQGRAAEAIAETRRAVDLDPTSLVMRAQLGRALYLGQRFAEAITTCRELLQMDENYAQAYLWLGQAYTQLGKHADAIAALEKANRLTAGRIEMQAALGHAYAVAGHVSEAHQIILDLQRRTDPMQQAYSLATIYVGLGNHAAAQTQLEMAYQQHSPMLILRSKLDPKLDALRKEPAFTALQRRLGLTLESQ